MEISQVKLRKLFPQTFFGYPTNFHYVTIPGRIANMRRKLLVAALIIAAGVVGFAFLVFPGAEDSFQRDADIVRLRHLEHYGKLIEEFRSVTGRVPLQGKAEVPIYVHIANDQQIEFTKNGPPYPHKVIPVAEFVAELESGLGRTIDEYYDPQYRPYKKPNFYIYMVRGDSYFVAVHVSQPFPFATKIGEAYYKIEISNAANSQNGATKPQSLFANAQFATARDQPVKKKLFSLRDEKYLNYSKQE